MRHRSILAGTVVLCLLCVLGLKAQQADSGASNNTNLPVSSQSAAGTVPRLIKFAGEIGPQITQIAQMTESPGGKNPLPTALGVTFSLYELQEGGSPLWSESQKVQVDQQGHYTVLLGATQPEGLPLDLFTTGKALWVGVQAQLPGQAEQPRVLLVAVPYSLKSSDADTLGGLPASAYALAGSATLLASPGDTQHGNQAGQVAGSASSPQPQAACAAVTSDGTATANTVAKFTAPCKVENSLIRDNGTGVAVGGTSTPGALFDVQYTSTATSGGLLLGQRVLTTLNPAAPSSATTYGIFSNVLTASGNTQNFTGKIFPSYSELDHYGTGTLASAHGMKGAVVNEAAGTITDAYGVNAALTNVSTGVITNGYGVYVSSPVNSGGGTFSNYTGLYIDTPAPLTGAYGLYSAGGKNYFGGNVGIGTTTPGANLEVNGTAKFDGLVTFKSGQTFPGTGTVSSVASGAGLTGGPITSTGTLSIAAAGVTDAMLANPYSGTGACAAGSFVTKLTRNATPNCAAGNLGTVSSVASGAGLMGGPITSTGTLSIATAGVTDAMLANPYSGVGSCAAGKVVTALARNAVPTCVTAGAGTVTSVGSGAGLTGGPITGTGTLSIAAAGVTDAMLANSYSGTGACAAGQVVTALARNGAPTCVTANMGTVTGVMAGTDLTGGGASGNVTLNLDTTKVPTLAAATNVFSGGVSAFSFSGNGSGLTSLNPSNLASGTAGISITGNAATATTAASTTTAGNAANLGGVAASNYARLDIGNNFMGNQSVSGNVSATGSVSGGAASFSGALTAAGAALPATGAATASAGANSEPLDLLASSFNSTGAAAVNQHFRWQVEPTGNNTASPSGTLNLLFSPGNAAPAETGLSIASNGAITFAAGQAFPSGAGTVTSVGSGPGLTGGPITSSGSLSIASGGVTNAMLANPSLTLTAGTDLTGGGSVALGSGVTLNLDTTKVPQLSAGNTFTVNQNFKGNGNSAQIGDMGCGSGFVGLSLFPGSLNCTTYAVMGDTSGNLYVNRPTGSSMYFREGNGTELTLLPGGSLTMTGNLFTNNISAGMVTGSSFVGDGSKLTFAGNGESAVIGNMGCSLASVGISFQGSSCSNFALLDYSGQTVLNRTSGQKLSFREGNDADQMTILAGGGVVVNGGFTVNSGSTPVFVSGNGKQSNYGAYATFTVLNYTSNNSTQMFLVWAPNNGESNCYIDTSANFDCSGPASTVASVDDGSRKVTLYATQSPENWFEDYGSGTLVNGVVTVTLEPVFAQTINAAVGYRVFVTPNGDCHGLYVANKTATSFEVHELGGGHADIDFDYRIVGKRKGYENVRLADQTERFKRMKAQHDSEVAAAEKQ